MARLQILKRITREFHGAGVRLLIGTDAKNTGTVPGTSAHDEMQEMVDAGLSPFEVLRAATANAAEFLGDRQPSGQVAVGHGADLILLDANPLENIANSRRIASVMLRGRWIPRSKIADILEQLRSSEN